ncbi:TetR/AcrR family transcriptional regulator [Parashewanella tropica]|uniref:TetR/AcrR family transcriptional regulator n=1 Tax=Parashewanella tropica TaxID=2547970 RepID=UPI0010597C69|nr:TetR/AcrR family transcriptional regulator [Parashewanella tropica]
MNPKQSVRAKLIETGTSLLAINPGASLSEIAKYAGVGRASLHRHFSSKEALVSVLSIEAIRQFKTALNEAISRSEIPVEQLSTLIELLVPHGDCVHFILYEWKTFEHQETMTEYLSLEREILALIESCKQQGTIANTLSSRWIYYLIDSTVYTAWYAIQDGTLAAREAPKVASNNVLNGLKR